MTTELTTSEQAKPVARWKQILGNAMPQLAESLPRHITPDRFRQVASVAISRNKDIMQCMDTDPKAVLLALADCAKDGLLPDGREAALVPFKGSLTYIPMIRGVLKQMRNSGEIASISAQIVHENDTFSFRQGDDEKLDHEPNWKGDRGEPVAAYAIIKMTSGEIYREVMSKAEIMAVKNASRAKGGPWSGPFVLEMWRKTVLKRAAKYCPLSDERIQTMLDRDNDIYDLDRANRPTPIESRFESMRREQPRPRYDAIESDEVPARDVNEDDIIDADPSPESVDSKDEISEAANSEVVDTGQADDTSSPPPESGMNQVQQFYIDALGRMKKARGDECEYVMSEICRDPMWLELSESKKRQIMDLGGV